MALEPVTEQDVTAVIIEEWAKSTSLAKRLAAKIALEIASLPPNTLLESSLKLEAKYDASHPVVVGARKLLADANLIHKEKSVTTSALKRRPNKMRLRLHN